MKSRWWPLFLAVMVLAAARGVAAQSFPLTGTELADPAALPGTMRRLAGQVLAAYQEKDRRTELDHRFRLQIVAGRYDEASRSLAALRALRTAPGATAQALATNVQYEIYARARALEAADGRPFAETFPQAFREMLAGLDDRTSALVLRSFSANRSALDDNLRRAIRGQEGKTEIPLAA